MNDIKITIQTIYKRPLIIILPSIFAFLYCLYEYFIIFPALLILKTISMGNVFNTGFHLFQFLLKMFQKFNNTFFSNYLIIISFILLLFIFNGAISIYFNYINKAIKREKFEFLKTIKKYYFKTSLYSIVATTLIILFTIFILISMLPAFVINTAITTYSKYYITSFLINTISVFILIFTQLALLSYLSFWGVSLYAFEKKCYRIARFLVNKVFWKLIFSILLFEILFIVAQILFIEFNFVLSNASSNSIIGILVLLILNWIFKSSMLAFGITYIFIIFNRIKDEC